MDFVVKDDPFDIYKLERDIAKVKKEIENGDLGPVPVPTHTALEVPYSQGQDTEVVWLGQIIHRNLRDLFELHYSRTGEVLDPAVFETLDSRTGSSCWVRTETNSSASQ